MSRLSHSTSTMDGTDLAMSAVRDGGAAGRSTHGAVRMAAAGSADSVDARVAAGSADGSGLVPVRRPRGGFPAGTGLGRMPWTLLALHAATAEPTEHDQVLRQRGIDLAQQHQAESGEPMRCRNHQCSSNNGYPCYPRRIAERLVAASAAGWPQCWTARHDALSCGLSPSSVAAGVTAQQVPGPVTP